MHKYELICFCKWCQHLPWPELAKLIKELGFDGVDLPVRSGAPIDHTTAPKQLPEAARIFRDHGLRLARLVTGLEQAGPDEEKLLETAAALGVRKIRLNGYSVGAAEKAPARLDEARRQLAGLEKILAKHGVSGAIQNHSGETLDVNVSSCLRMMEHCDPRWVGIQYDPGHLTLSGESIKLALGLMGPYLHSVNLKSPRQEYYVNPQTGRLAYVPTWVPLRDGMLDVPDVLRALSSAGYTDPISIHAEYRTYFYRVEQNLSATNKLVADDVAYIRKILAEAGRET